MKQAYLRTIYTEEDEKGFHFIDVLENEKKEQIAQLKVKRNKWILILIVLMIPAIMLYYILKTEIEKAYVDGYVMICFFIVGVNIYYYYSRIRRIKREIEQYFKVEYGIIEIHFLFNLTSNAEKFLQSVQNQVAELGIKIQCLISKEGNDET